MASISSTDGLFSETAWITAESTADALPGLHPPFSVEPAFLTKLSGFDDGRAGKGIKSGVPKGSEAAPREAQKHKTVT